jgi:diacylglycerol kinase (ATP)
MDKFLTKKNFSIIARARSFKHAFRGVGIMIRTQHNAWVHLLAVVVVTLLGFNFDISLAEWSVLVLAMGFVLAAEAFNTAIEIDIDLTSPTYHPYARDTKDVAAGAVLISVIVSVVIGLVIFLPKIIVIYSN